MKVKPFTSLADLQVVPGNCEQSLLPEQNGKHESPPFVLLMQWLTPAGVSSVVAHAASLAQSVVHQMPLQVSPFVQSPFVRHGSPTSPIAHLGLKRRHERLPQQSLMLLQNTPTLAHLGGVAHFPAWQVSPAQQPLPHAWPELAQPDALQSATVVWHMLSFRQQTGVSLGQQSPARAPVQEIGASDGQPFASVVTQVLLEPHVNVLPQQSVVAVQESPD